MFRHTTTLSGTSTTILLSVLGLASSTGCSDNTIKYTGNPPVAAIDRPTTDTSVHEGDTVDLQGTVADRQDPSETLEVTWFADNERICADSTPDTEGKVSCAWTATHGTTKLTLHVRDSDTESSEASIDINVTQSAAPTIQITAPTEHLEYYEDTIVPLEATVSDPDNSPTDLTVTWASSAGTVTLSTPGSVDSSGSFLSGASLSAGDHQLTATVTDPYGNTGTDSVFITVHGENTAPSCAFTSPERGATFAPGDTILFEGTCTDAETAPTQLTLTLESHLAGELDDDVPINTDGAFTLPVSTLPAGDHVITITATDSRGEEGVDTLTISVCEGTWYTDDDGDGYGDPTTATDACIQPSGTVDNGDDCDDTRAHVAPGAAENESLTDCMADADGDGYGDSSVPTGITAGTDCNDADSAVHPAATEVCNTVDDDCDGDTDDADSSVDTSTGSTFYADTDTDGYGNASSTTLSCTVPSGYVTDATDCNDTDSAVNPGATEVCNTIDDDCDGDIDDNDSSVDTSTGSTFYADTDTDGFGDASSTTVTCAVPSGYVSNGSDCDDTDSSVNPSATEVCNTIDDDCDGDIDDNDTSLDASTTGSTWYSDADSDGFGDPSASTTTCTQPSAYVTDNTDCDDTDSAVYPGAEVCGDGILTGCDTEAEANRECLEDTFALETDSFAELVGGDANDQSGRTVASAGDFDGDGYDDILIGAPFDDLGSSDAGTAYLLFGGVSGTVDIESEANAYFYGESSQDAAGLAIAGVGDVNNDGLDDILVGAHFEDGGGSAYLVYGGHTGGLNLASADAIFYGEDQDDFVGSAVAGAGDTNGDGYADLLIGGYGTEDSSSTTDRGRAYLVFGSISGTQSITASDASFSGEAAYDRAGYRVSGGGDTDGDGLDDILICAHGQDGGGDHAGAVYVVYGGVSSDISLSAADAKFNGEAASDVAGIGLSSAGDLNGDGLDDILIGASQNNEGGTDSGIVYVVLGGVTGTHSLSTAYAEFIGEDSYDYTGSSLSGTGDVDGDGVGDILIGSILNDTTASNAGAAYLVLGGVSGSHDLSDAHTKFTGGAADDNAGGSVAGAGDVDGDGLNDLLIGAYQEDDGGSSAGKTYLFLGSQF